MSEELKIILLKYKTRFKSNSKDKDIASILLFRHYLTNLFHLKRDLETIL